MAKNNAKNAQNAPKNGSNAAQAPVVTPVVVTPMPNQQPQQQKKKNNNNNGGRNNNKEQNKDVTLASDLEMVLTNLLSDPFTLAAYAFSVYLAFSVFSQEHFLVDYLCKVKFASPQLLTWVVTHLEKLVGMLIFYVGVRRMPFRYYSTMLIGTWLWVWLLPTATLWMYVLQSISLWVFVTAKLQHAKIAAMALVALLAFSESFVQFQYHPHDHDLSNLTSCFNATIVSKR